MTDRSPAVGEAARFVLVGGANTLVTGLVFYLLASAVPASLAYVVSYGIGIVLAGVVIPTVVFRRPATLHLAGRVGAGYLAVLLLGLLLVVALDPHVGRAAVVLLVMGITVPLNFALARWLSRVRSPLTPPSS